MAEIATGSFTHTLEQIDDAVSEVSSTIGESASLTAAVESIAGDAAATAAATAAASAIADLDVSSVGGSGKYISAIEEENGKISATVTNLATSITNGGAEAVTSGAVYTAVSSKIGKSDVFGLGTKLTTGADLNTYNSNTYLGCYYTENSSIASSCVHRPDYENANSKGFRLEVKTGTGNTRIIQEMTVMQTSGANIGTVEKFMRCYTSSGWGDWYQMNTTAVNTYAPASLNSINPSQLQIMPPDDGEEIEDR